MIPTKGWDERARTAPVPVSDNQYQDTNMKKTTKQATQSLLYTWMTPCNYRQPTSCTEAGSQEHFFITSISKDSKL